MIYVASPYTHLDPAVREQRYKDVLEYTKSRLLKGEVVFSPIVYGHQFTSQYNLPVDAEYWQAFNHHMLRQSCAFRILCLAGWQESKGVTEEIKLARSRKIPMHFVMLYMT